MYKKTLKNRISDILSKNSKITFEELCKACLGAFPLLIFSFLDEKQRKRFPKTTSSGVMLKKKQLPSENPANYDWRFTQETCVKLSEKIKGHNFKIALFGAPALYLELLKHDENVHLFDINSLLPRHLPKKENIHIIDLNTHTFKEVHEFDCVFMDPPWYNDYYKKWISQANIITKKGGTIYASLFQELLRPEAKKERQKILADLALIGPVKTHHNRLNYSTPPFEQEVFDYYNIPIQKHWRIGDLVQVQNDYDRIKPQTVSTKDNWLRFEINKISIALKDQGSTEKIVIKKPYKNGDDLLKSISFRNDTKKKVNLITSRNKGYIVKGNTKLAAILRAIENGSEPNATYKKYDLDKKEILQVSNFLKTISL